MAELERRHGERPAGRRAETPPVDAVHDGPQAWASAVGSRGVEQIASSPGAKRLPVGRESLVQASSVLARQESDVIEMPEETITAGGGASDVIEMPEETITAGGGGSDVIEMPEETITAGGGASDVIEMPEETITAGGGG
jgi:hypothetical protein